MKLLVTLCFSMLPYSSSFLFSSPVAQTQAESERYIMESERQWAESVATGETSAIERILADDFVGVSPEGTLYDKKKMVVGTRTAPETFVSNHLNEVKVRFFGDTAVAQGNESWEERKGNRVTAIRLDRHVDSPQRPMANRSRGRPDRGRTSSGKVNVGPLHRHSFDNSRCIL